MVEGIPRWQALMTDFFSYEQTMGQECCADKWVIWYEYRQISGVRGRERGSEEKGVGMVIVIQVFPGTD